MKCERVPEEMRGIVDNFYLFDICCVDLALTSWDLCKATRKERRKGSHGMGFRKGRDPMGQGSRKGFPGRVPGKVARICDSHKCN